MKQNMLLHEFHLYNSRILSTENQEVEDNITLYKLHFLSSCNSNQIQMKTPYVSYASKN